jgi:predicted RNase H-like nuclease (RuvC/YqgF family)
MDTRGARELAQRLADEERRRSGAADNAAAADGTGDVAAAVDHLQREIESLRAELAAREDTIARLRTELAELRTKVTAVEDAGSDVAPQDEVRTKHVLFVSRPSAYEVLEREGRVPEVGSEIELGDSGPGLYRVSKVGPSPLPGDRRRCAFLELLP